MGLTSRLQSPSQLGCRASTSSRSIASRSLSLPFSRLDVSRHVYQKDDQSISQHDSALSSIEMYVASDTSMPSLQSQDDGGRRLVPPPRFTGSGPPQSMNGPYDRFRMNGASNNGAQNGALASREGAVQTRALKQELGAAAADLQSKNRELAQAEVALRMKDREMKLVKEQLAESKMELRQVKGELREVYARMQAKDTELLAAYEQLMDAAKERARLRDALILSEQDLMLTRTELKTWADGLMEVKSLMDSLEEETGISMGGDFGIEEPEKEDSEENEGDSVFDGAVSYMKNLTEISKQLLDDAAEDDKVYNNAYWQVEKKGRDGK